MLRVVVVGQQLQRRSVALLVAVFGPGRGRFVGSSARGNGRAPPRVLGRAAIPFAGLDQGK
jgi:hypothetical protein